MHRKIIFTIFFVILIYSSGFAHDVWMEKKEGKLIVQWGHADKTEPYDPAKVREVKAFDIWGKEIAVSLAKEKDSVAITPREEVAVVTLVFDSGFWTKTTEGFKNIPKKGVEGVMESFHSLRFSKEILRWSDKLAKPVGMEFELVPLKNPLSAKFGGILPVKVFYEGKPLEGAKIYGGGKRKDALKTGPDGIANVVIGEVGNHKIGALHKIPLHNNPDADYLVRTTNLTFEVKQ